MFSFRFTILPASIILPRDNAYLFYFIINKEHFIIDASICLNEKKKETHTHANKQTGSRIIFNGQPVLFSQRETTNFSREILNRIPINRVFVKKKRKKKENQSYG